LEVDVDVPGPPSVFDLVTISHAELGPLPLVYLIGTTTRSFLPGSLLAPGYYFMDF
jgi:hypothetical protein